MASRVSRPNASRDRRSRSSRLSDAHSSNAGLSRTVRPLRNPETSNAAAAVNFDTTLAGTVNVQMKNSGANASTYVVQDLQVNSIT